MAHTIEGIIKDTKKNIRLLEMGIIYRGTAIQDLEDKIFDLKKELQKKYVALDAEKSIRKSLMGLRREKKFEIIKLYCRLYWYTFKEKAGSFLHILA